MIHELSKKDKALLRKFDKLNVRRGDLIHKKYWDEKGLTRKETQELEELQEIDGQVRDVLTPKFSPKLAQVIEQMSCHKK